MDRHNLHKAKKHEKEINSRDINFKKLKRNTLPVPFKRMGGPRVYSSNLINVSEGMCVLFIWRDGQMLTDTAFYGYLIKKISNNLLNLFEFHWHPSHKGYHCAVPCDVENHDMNRMIPKNSPELNLILDKNTVPNLDPRKDEDRLKLIEFFCEKINLRAISSDDERQNEIKLQ